MNALALERTLRHMDEQGVWLFSRPQFGVLFPDESDAALTKSLVRQTRAGRLMRVAHGLYANPDARSRGSYPLESIATLLRPLKFNYLSAETVLAEHGVISQLTQSYLTIMTTGASKRYVTPFGTIEFTHTKRDHRKQRRAMRFDAQRGFWVANTALAYRDLKRLGRNRHLVDLDELAAALAEERESESTDRQGDAA